MKYAVDFHGVAQKYPAIFKPMMEDLMNAGAENRECTNIVSILSGPKREQIEDELEEAGYIRGVHFNHILSVVDWLQFQKDYKDAKFDLTQDEKGMWWTDPVTWWSSKSKICAEFGIEVMWDDDERYFKYIVNERPIFFHVR